MSFHTEVLLFLLPWKMKIYEKKLISIGLWLPTSLLGSAVTSPHLKEGKNAHLFVWGIFSGS